MCNSTEGGIMPTHIVRTNAHDWNPGAKTALRKIDPATGEACNEPFAAADTHEHQPDQKEVLA